MRYARMAVSYWLLALGACSTPPTGPEPPPPGPDLQAVSCVADLSSSTIRCGSATAPRAASSGPVTVGGQGIYVLLASSGTSYNSGSHVFTTTVTVKNLTAEPLGTTDGVAADPEGIQVFFHAGPVTTSGTGSVSVANADGTGNFTAPGQPFFRYVGNLAGGATSAGKIWNFTVTGTVNTFTFQVYVRAQVPQATGILRFLVDSLGSTGTFYSVSGMSSTNVLALGVFEVDELSGGRLFRWGGSSWTVVADFTDLLYGSWATGTVIYGVGPDGVIWHSPDNGGQWTRSRFSSGALLNSAWASSPTDLFAVGGGGTILHSANGTDWSPMTSGSTQFLNSIWGTSASDIFAVGYGGTILHYNGSAWTPQTAPSGSTAAILYGAGGTPGGTLFVVGEGGRILRSVNGGGTWTTDASGTTNTLRAVWCASASDCVAAGDLGTVRRWNGSSWSPMASGTTKLLRAGWGASTTSVFLVGDQGTAVRGIR